MNLHSRKGSMKFNVMKGRIYDLIPYSGVHVTRSLDLLISLKCLTVLLHVVVTITMARAESVRAWTLNLCCRPGYQESARLDFVLRSMEVASPEIVCLQEVTHSSFVRLVEFAQRHHLEMHPTQWDQSVGVAVATLWRPEAEGTLASHLSAEPGTPMLRTAQAQGNAATPGMAEPVNLPSKSYSLRLPAPRGLDYMAVITRFGCVAVCNTHLPAGAEHQEVRMQALVLVLESLGQYNGPLILAGDMNSDLDRDADVCSMLGQAGLTDCWRVTHPQEPG